MIIQINTDNNIKGSEESTAPFLSLLTDKLKHFSHQITRIEVHLSDEDGSKDGYGAKRCLLEARLEGMKPIVASHKADSKQEAVSGAIDKLRTSLETKLGRLNYYDTR